ncbi:MAG TPA: TRAP transporter substrate-binding protein [Thauera phenylacetica]|jgi:TRAP-type C4-dicarboxylate transport system substrate-binding protein|nr:TRAP transporter substrate-binding protein [Thauera phenylacetica]
MQFQFKKIARGLIAGLTLSVAAAGANAQALKLGHITPPTHVWHQVSEKIATDLAGATEGKMKIAVSPLQKLGNEAQMINLMQSGAQQFGVFTVGGLSNREESFLAWSLPYVFKDVAHATRAASTAAAKEMLARLEQHGMIGLGYAFAGMRHVLSLQPVVSAGDLANKKIRSFPNPVYNDWWSANGAAPTAMPLSEVAPSLTTKLLDAVDVDLDALVGLKFHQQAPNLTLTGHMAFPAVIVVSKKWWDSRSQADRELILKVVTAAEQWGFKTAIDADVTNLDKAKADGANVVAGDMASFQAVGGKVRDQYTAKNPLIADFYRQAKDL